MWQATWHISFHYNLELLEGRVGDESTNQMEDITPLCTRTTRNHAYGSTP